MFENITRPERILILGFIVIQIYAFSVGSDAYVASIVTSVGVLLYALYRLYNNTAIISRAPKVADTRRYGNEDIIGDGSRPFNEIRESAAVTNMGTTPSVRRTWKTGDII